MLSSVDSEFSVLRWTLILLAAACVIFLFFAYSKRGQERREHLTNERPLNREWPLHFMGGTDFFAALTFARLGLAAAAIAVLPAAPIFLPACFPVFSNNQGTKEPREGPGQKRKGRGGRTPAWRVPRSLNRNRFKPTPGGQRLPGAGRNGVGPGTASAARNAVEEKELKSKFPAVVGYGF